MDTDSLASWVAVYAAIVATGALFLEIRRWFESGPRLRLTFMVDAEMLPRGDDNSYIVVTVAHRGSAPTTLTHFVLVTYPSVAKRLRRRPERQMYVPQPSTAQPAPHLLEPGAHWIGMAIQEKELEPFIDAGTLWAEVYATHADRPARIRLKRRPRPEDDAS